GARGEGLKRRNAPPVQLAHEQLRHDSNDITTSYLSRDAPLRLLRDSRRHVGGSLTRSKFDDPELRKPARMERILGEDGLDLGAVLADGEDDSAVARNLAA